MSRPRAIGFLAGGLLLALLCRLPAAAAVQDPWQQLQVRFRPSSPPVTSAPPADDPWAQLRAIYLPFSEQDDRQALSDRAAGRRVATGLHKALRPYRALIREASRRFDIPEAIIGAVIMVESGGHAGARAATSSAAGLMQTIAATFGQARRQLAGQGLFIKNDPCQPRASIMAGCWYLDRMFRQVQRDGGSAGRRCDPAAWRRALEYYYAGPGHGRKQNDVVIIYAGGRRVRIDKPAYSRKVLQWARVLARG